MAKKHLITCWKCLGEYELISAGWCSCEGKGPTKVCPYCYSCFCDLSPELQEDIWRNAPIELREEQKILAAKRSKRKKSKQEQIFDMFELSRDTYKILVVEDDPGIQRFLKKLLKTYFLVPIIVTRGDEALKILQKELIHLVILDLMIPGMNGFKVCKHIKENHITRNIPIIITTGRSNVLDKVKGFVIGVDDYLTKPYQSTELIIRLLNLIRKNNLI